MRVAPAATTKGPIKVKFFLVVSTEPLARSTSLDTGSATAVVPGKAAPVLADPAEKLREEEAVSTMSSIVIEAEPLLVTAIL